MILYMTKILEYYGDLNEEIMRDALKNFPETSIIDTGAEQIPLGCFSFDKTVKEFREKFNL